MFIAGAASSSAVRVAGNCLSDDIGYSTQAADDDGLARRGGSGGCTRRDWAGPTEAQADGSYKWRLQKQ